MKSSVKGVIVCLLQLFFLVESASAITPEEVSNELVCQCGCGLVLNNCNHSDCGVAIPMRDTIKQKIRQGESLEQIVAYYVSQYGEVVLSTPTKQGFNLTVWILPFIGLAVGAGIIILMLFLWTRKRRYVLANKVLKKVETQKAGSEKYEKIFEQEFQDFE